MAKTKTFWVPGGIVFIIAIVGVAVWLMHVRRPEETVPDDRVSEDVPVDEGMELIGEWNTYHGDAALSGAVSVAPPDRLAPLWRFRAGSAVRTTPVASAGRIFVANDRGEILAVDLRGERLWSVKLTRGEKEDGTPVEEVIDAPLACFDELVLAGTADGTIYALDVATGEERWQYDVGGSILGTPNRVSVPAEGEDTDRAAMVVVSQNNGALHCVDMKDGQPIWQTEGVSRCDGSPAVGDGRVVFGSCVAALHVFSVVDGRLERNIEVGADSEVAGGVAVYGESVFTGSRSGTVLHANLLNGATQWTNNDIDGEVFTTPAVSSDYVVFASDNGFVYALDRETGDQRWTFDTEGTPSSPVIAGDKLVVTSDGSLYMLRMEDGTQVWSYEVSDVITGAAVVGRRIVVGSEDGTVTAFGRPAA